MPGEYSMGGYYRLYCVVGPGWVGDVSGPHRDAVYGRTLSSRRPLRTRRPVGHEERRRGDAFFATAVHRLTNWTK
jgi:hypothetical protein